MPSFATPGQEGACSAATALHYHLVGDTMRGSSVIGASIWDSHNRWLTIHGTNYLVVRDCVGYKSVGHGFFFETARKVFNVLDRNLAVGARRGKALPKQVLPFDHNDGAGFWWSNSLNTFTRNVAADKRPVRLPLRGDADQPAQARLPCPAGRRQFQARWTSARCRSSASRATSP